MSESIVITVYARTNKVGSDSTRELEFDRDEWEGMSEDERQAACRDVMFEMIEWGWDEP